MQSDKRGVKIDFTLVIQLLKDELTKESIV